MTMIVGACTASLYNMDLLPCIGKIAELGFNGIELLAFSGARHNMGDLAGFWFNRLCEEDKQKLKEALSLFSGIAIHAPFMDLPMFSYSASAADNARTEVKHAMEAADFLGASVVTTHVNGRFAFELSQYKEEVMAVYRDLGDYADKHHTQITIETGYPGCVEEFCALIEDVDHPCVGATLDIGHVRSSVAQSEWCTPEAGRTLNRNIIKIIERLKSKIMHVHMHDVRSEDWQDHLCAGTGILDFPTILETLASCGYKGLLSFELEETHPVECLRKSRKFVEDLLTVSTDGSHS